MEFGEHIRDQLHIVTTSALGSFVATMVMYLSEANLNISPIVTAPAFVFVALFIALYKLYKARNLRSFTMQGEDIENFEGCGFGKEDDPEDETGRTIVNYRVSWRLHGRLRRLGRKGRYLANIRFKKLADTQTGEFVFSVKVGHNEKGESSIALSDLPLLQYQYLDMQFDYDGLSNVDFSVHPVGGADTPRVIGVDRFECYLLPKARIMQVGHEDQN